MSAVGFRVAELGRRGERPLERVAVDIHAVEDEVGRAVDDAEDARDAVAREAVAERADDGDRAADRGLVVQLRADLLCGVEELGTVRREQRLVGGDDVGAGVDGLQDVGARRLEPAHELDHDVGAEDEALGVGRQQVPGDRRGALGLDVAHGDSDELEARAGAVGEFVAVLQQECGHLGADAAAAQEGDAEVAVLDHSLSFIELSFIAGLPIQHPC
jgi:hypothetical protein